MCCWVITFKNYPVNDLNYEVTVDCVLRMTPAKDVKTIVTTTNEGLLLDYSYADDHITTSTRVNEPASTRVNEPA